MADFDAECTHDRDAALWRMDMRYSRSPEKRKELDAPIDDTEKTTLQRRRAELVFGEFSRTWNRQDGWQP